MRFGVECEGRYAGLRTLVLLGAVPWARIIAALRAKKPQHVYWELGVAPDWAAVARLARRSGLTVTVEVGRVEHLPARLSDDVEVVLRVPPSFARVDTLKTSKGTWAVSHGKVSVKWRTTSPSDYAADEVLWP